MEFKEFMLWLIPIIIGIFLPLLITHWRKKRDTSLYFKPIACYKLFREDIKKLNIDIRYQGTTIENNLILFNGSLTNNGHKDIAKEHIHKQLEIKVDPAFKWRELRIIKSPEGATINVQNENDCIKFDWDLLQKGESFEFETLIEAYDQTKKVKDFLDSIQFNYRITNLHAIDKKDGHELDSTIYLKMGILFFFIGVISCTIPLFKKEYNVEYTVVNSHQDTITLKIETTEKLEQLKIKDGQEMKQMSIADFQNKYKILNLKTLPMPYKLTSGVQCGFIFFMMSFLSISISFIANSQEIKRVRNYTN